MEIRGAKKPVASSSFLRFGTRLGLGGDSNFIWGLSAQSSANKYLQALPGVGSRAPLVAEQLSVALRRRSPAHRRERRNPGRGAGATFS